MSFNLNIVQFVEVNGTGIGAGSFSTNFQDIFCTFPNPITSGNSILLITSGMGAGILGNCGGVFSITDTLGNIYSPFINTVAAFQGGVGASLTLVPSSLGGVDTIDVKFTQDTILGTPQYVYSILAMELSFVATPSIFDSHIGQQFGGGHPQNLTANLSPRGTITVNYDWNFGANHDYVIINILSNGVNYIVPVQIHDSATFITDPTTTGYTLRQDIKFNGTNIKIYTYDVGIQGAIVGGTGFYAREC